MPKFVLRVGPAFLGYFCLFLYSQVFGFFFFRFSNIISTSNIFHSPFKSTIIFDHIYLACLASCSLFGFAFSTAFAAVSASTIKLVRLLIISSWIEGVWCFKMVYLVSFHTKLRNLIKESKALKKNLLWSPSLVCWIIDMQL